MARKSTKTGTAVANIDEELRQLAGQSATLTDSGGGGKFISTRSGILQYDDSALPGNQMCAIVIAWCLENVYYDGPFDPDNRAPPTCFAFCKNPDEKDEMGPNPEHLTDDVFEQQSDLCRDCPQNEWGSARQGRGKACGNRRRLALLPAGTYSGKGSDQLELIEDDEHFRTCEEAYLKVPVMSGKGFDAYVRDVSEQFNKPLFAVYTRIYILPDAKSQFKVHFELIEPVDKDLLPALLERYKKLHETIDFPYVPFTEDEDEQPARKASASKKLTKGRRK